MAGELSRAASLVQYSHNKRRTHDFDQPITARAFLSCSKKGRTLGTEEIDSPSAPFNFSIDDLNDGLLIEILHRLPATKFAIQCKLVSKRWYSLISSCYFIRCFINRHTSHYAINNNISSNDTLHNNENPYGVILSYCNPQHEYTILTISDESMLKFSGFKLSFLPEGRDSVSVLASFNDLLLCCVSKFSKNSPTTFHHYVCNPFTMQWFGLPSLIGKSLGHTRVGFVCEDNRGECTVHNEYRYRVVRVSMDGKMRLFVETYCSESNKWDESFLSTLKYLPHTNIVAYNGKLHWYTGKNVVAYDPFNPEQSCFIDASKFKFTMPEGTWMDAFYCIGVCQGFLRIMQLLLGSASLTDSHNTLAVWELKDYRTGEWSLESKVYLNTFISESYFIQEVLTHGNFLCPLGFNPCAVDIVYLRLSDLVISCNMRTRDLKLAGMIPHRSHFDDCNNVFPVALPWWPTPIHSLPQNSNL